jgi:hypothetical protein
LSSAPAKADQIDYILSYANLAAAKADAAAVAEGFNVSANDWAADHAMQVTVTRISTGATITGFFVLISAPRVNSSSHLGREPSDR